MKKGIVNKNSLFNFLLGWIIFESPIIFILVFLFNRFGFSKDTNMYQLAYYSVFVVLFLVFLFNRTIKKKAPLLFVTIIIVFIAAFIRTAQQNVSVFSLDKTGFEPLIYLLFFPCVSFVFVCLHNFEHAEKALIWFARVLCWISIIQLFNSYSNFIGDDSFYSMTIGYDLAISSIFLFLSFVRKKNAYDFIVFLFLFALILFFGNRGSALAVIISSVCVYLFVKCKNKNVFFAIRHVLLILIIFLIFVVIKDVLFGCLDFVAKSFGIQSRTLERLLSGSIYDDNGRNAIQNAIIFNWNKMPFFGYGLLGDRQFANGSYSHNLVIELITTFGFFISFVIIGLLLSSFLIRIKKAKDCRGLFSLIGSFVVAKLLFSGSFATETVFFVFVGCCFNVFSLESDVRDNQYSSRYNLLISRRFQ